MGNSYFTPTRIKMPENYSEMVKIIPGTFMMGSVSTEIGRVSDETIHQVTITNDFYIGKYPVTQELWANIYDYAMGFSATHTTFNLIGGFIRNPSEYSGSRKPVSNISWDIINSAHPRTGYGFLHFLNLREHHSGSLPENMEYRLPTEAQWEYACRAGVMSAVSCSLYNGLAVTEDYATGSVDQPNLSQIAWYVYNNTNNGQPTGPKPVGLKQPNAWGLYDMLGNVWEWCSDLYGPYTDNPVINPIGSTTGNNRILRGGYWGSTADKCRCAQRKDLIPASIGINFGMRLMVCETNLL